MKFGILQKLVIFAVIILIGNGIMGYAIYQSNQKRLQSEHWVEHTLQVISLSNSILTSVKDLEIASRTFVITNDIGYLVIYNQAKSNFTVFGKLRQLIQDNPEQQKRLDSLRIYSYRYLDFSSQTIEIRQRQGVDAAIAHIVTMRGKRDGDKIRSITSAIQQEETFLLKQRKVTNEQSVVALNWLTIVMFILMAVFTILLLVITGYYLRQVQDKQRRAAELILVNKELDFQQEEKTKQEVANTELEAFSYSVSHDLRAPLRHIGGFVDLLMKSNASQLDEKGLRYLTIISESALEMGNLIDALLTFSRLSRTELERTIIITNIMVAKVIKTFSDEFSARNIEFKIADLPDTLGDDSLMYQVWMNLISNAVKYSRNKEKAVIEIGSHTGNREIVFYIKDNGAGFNMKYADKLFGVFQRLHKSRDFEGIGIGLANVNRIVVRHGGKCWAESEAGAGATFFFSIPNI